MNAKALLALKDREITRLQNLIHRHNEKKNAQCTFLRECANRCPYTPAFQRDRKCLECPRHHCIDIHVYTDDHT